MRLSIVSSLFAGAALAAAAPVAAQSFTAAESAQVDTLVGEALAATGVPSASVTVVRGGKIAFAKAYGKQSETIATADIKTKYQIASVSKQFTAAAILLLRDEGKLSLDDTIAKYLPGITGGDRITIRQLLAHTSGLQDYWPQDFSFAAMATPTSPQGIVDRWARKPLDFEPGSQWQYSNTGYVVAGLIVEKLSGMELVPFLKNRLLDPLGIDAIDQDLATGKGYPQGYTRAALGPVKVETPPASGWLYAAGELSMSTPDLAKWDIARIERKGLPAKDWAEQEQAVKLTDGASTHYGLGVTLAEVKKRATVEHGGEAVGFLTTNRVFVEDKAAIVVAVNAWFGDAQSRIADGIGDILFPDRKTASTGLDETARTAMARKVYDQLREGMLDRAMLTEDANYYYTAGVQADYRDSLGSLGEPTAFATRGAPRLRGGFVVRGYVVSYGERKLNISTMSELGQDGRFEQFLVTPGS
ncbi:serine hydrolase [Sphingomonas naphthae]|uniref:Serine hydrolase n=1 Tax=Sphingomonas naphthae TaxID=1813468 RepID=A0ABY7TNE5_9SPHN|nr:serine hydrolase domain-containing protein [Sphingomonas naphthae]WCT74246.1 serine hydrolase [Sphingomonas naphthae]